MRFVKNIENDYCKAELYQFNNKYIIKFEAGMLEQIYKVSEFDVSGEEDIEEMMGDGFLRKVVERFKDMENDFDAIIDTVD